MNKEKYNLNDFLLKHEISTRWKDLDAFGHINNAVFLSYIEDARILFFKRWNINLKEKSLIVASIKIDYIKQLEHPSEIIIGQKIVRLGKKSFDIQSAIFKKSSSKLICTSIVTSVCYDFINNKTVEIFDEIKNDYQK